MSLKCCQQAYQALRQSNTKLRHYHDSSAEFNGELKIEYMAKGKKKQRTPAQEKQIMTAIEESIRQREHKRGKRTSTRGRS